MCIRYDKDTGRAIRFSRRIGAWIWEEDWREGKDTFPGYTAPAVTPDWSRGRNGKQLVKATWGLQPAWDGKPLVWTGEPPPWARDPKWGIKSAYNARCETIFRLPAFREAILQRRCVVPLEAFYEQSDGRWWRFRRRDEETLAVAAVYEEPHELAETRTFALITTQPTELALSVGHDRMLVLLRSEDEVDAWLAKDTPKHHLRALMTPCSENYLVVEDAGSTKRKKTEREEPGQEPLF